MGCEKSLRLKKIILRLCINKHTIFVNVCFRRLFRFQGSRHTVQLSCCFFLKNVRTFSICYTLSVHSGNRKVKSSFSSIYSGLQSLVFNLSSVPGPEDVKFPIGKDGI